VRDVDPLSRLAIGIKALGCNPRKSARRGEGSRDLAVRFAEITINPGDYLYADADGIVVADRPLT
jgi:regulator of ribonuclease activity A